MRKSTDFVTPAAEVKPKTADLSRGDWQSTIGPSGQLLVSRAGSTGRL